MNYRNKNNQNNKKFKKKMIKNGYQKKTLMINYQNSFKIKLKTMKLLNLCSISGNQTKINMLKTLKNSLIN